MTKGTAPDQEHGPPGGGATSGAADVSGGGTSAGAATAAAPTPPGPAATVASRLVLGWSPPRVTAVAASIIAVVLLGAALQAVRSVAIPFVLALFLAYVVAPVVRALQTRLHLPRLVALLATILLVLGLLGGVVTLLTMNLAELINSGETYRARVLYLAEAGIGFARRFGITLDESFVKNSLRDLPVFSLAAQAARALGGFLSTGLLVAIFVLFLLAGTSPLPVARRFYVDVDRTLRRYLVTKVVTSLTTGVLVFVILSAVGLELAFTFAITTVLLNFIPTVGSIIAVLLPLPVAMLQYETIGPFLVVLLLPTAVQFLIGSIIEPRVLGDRLDLHPATVLLSLLLWGYLWGPVGMLLSVPIAATARLILARTPGTAALGDLMAGRLPSDDADMPAPAAATQEPG